MQLVFIMILHVLISVALIVLVLLQRGKGTDMGAALGSGSGASGTMFGSQGSTPFTVKLIGGLGALFFCTSLALSYLVSTSKPAQPDVLDVAPSSTVPAIPVSPIKPDTQHQQQSGNNN